MSEKLNPCPFCGKTDPVGVFLHSQIVCLDDLYDEDYFAVCCDAQKGGCGAVGGYKEERGDAIDVWNRRAPLYESVKLEDVTPGYYWLVTPDTENTIERIWDGYGDGSLGIESPEGWVAVSEIYEMGGVLYRIPDLEVAE